MLQKKGTQLFSATEKSCVPFYSRSVLGCPSRSTSGITWGL